MSDDGMSSHDTISVVSDQIKNLQEYDDGEDETAKMLAQMDLRVIRFSKLAVLSVMMIVAGSMGALFFLLSEEDEDSSFGPAACVAVALAAFLPLGASFALFDWLVRRRHHKVLEAAGKSNAIVSSFFPGVVRDRIMIDAEERHDQGLYHSTWRGYGAAPKAQLKTFLQDEAGVPTEVDNAINNSKPIAEFFPEVTIMFADIVGFTAWSSVREPVQVFKLLEAVFAAFDDVARKRRVFKVETVGDCYVAVAGLPDPRPDHAIVMARFARDCLSRMNAVTTQLELALGPGTGDLALRIGLHSGPVTAGVLRGDKSRFQLFGDSMNTTSRVEHAGEPNRIHLSMATAELLIQRGKAHWLKERVNGIHAKGKGHMLTYWLDVRSGAGSVSGSVATSDDADRPVEAEDKSTCFDASAAMDLSDMRQCRLVNWHADVLLRLLRELAARREALDMDNPTRRPLDTEEKLQELESCEPSLGTGVLDEVKEIVMLPNFNAIADKYQRDPDLIELSKEVKDQVCNYVRALASLYHKENAFHNFEHASHVTMSTIKLLSRIVAPDLTTATVTHGESSLHDHTYGITSDPLTRFACIFSSLIHDVDHPGLPNVQLVKEGLTIAKVYENRSVAEQNSVDLAWKLLMSDQYKAFRRTIYSSVSGFHRFRQLVVNAVMATDIMDSQLKQIRNGRWEKAFTESQTNDESETVAVNRKATIVIEHLIQASDVSHTMQHWHVYTKWNERLFCEMYKAYQEGRAEKDPSAFWYEGEKGFFDFYILPLAKKLKACGVFGVSSDEYLNYALNNRREWEVRGKELVETYLEKYARELANGGNL